MYYPCLLLLDDFGPPSTLGSGEHMNSDEHLALSGALTRLSLLLHLICQACQPWEEQTPQCE